MKVLTKRKDRGLWKGGEVLEGLGEISQRHKNCCTPHIIPERTIDKTPVASLQTGIRLAAPIKLFDMTEKEM
jgi:hypothetical protein